MDDVAWDHNTHYQPLLLRELPAECERILDVGCGAGAFAARLAGRAKEVDALDRSPAMIEAARRQVPGNVTCIEDDVLTRPLPGEHYDAITSISALHHMPLPEVLPRLAAALRPGGVLVAIALPRVDLPRELPIELAAVLASRGRRVVRCGGVARAWRHWRALQSSERVPGEAMPVLDPQLTVRQVRSQVSAVLPGATVRRLLLWRYLLVWRKPAQPSGSGGQWSRQVAGQCEPGSGLPERPADRAGRTQERH